MNEITRVHIAKVAYDIEVGAKKELEKYIRSLEVYTKDTDVLEDIEIRMTELLAERGVKADGVIASNDIAAIRTQLGEPHEFSDGDTEETDTEVRNVVRKLYRNPDGAVLGGVLGGIATYFGIAALWLRLAFVVLLLVSFGTALLVYVLLWLIVPQARTAAEKLQLAGMPVTLGSIRELGAQEEQSASVPVLRKVLSIGFGVASLLTAAGTIVATVWGSVLVLTNDTTVWLDENHFWLGSNDGWLFWLLFGLVVAGLLLFAGLCSLIAYALLRERFTKRIGVSMLIVTVLGVVTFLTVMSVAATQSWRVSSEAQSMVRTTSVNLPKDFAGVASLAVGNPYPLTNTTMWYVRYVVDEGTPRYELSALPGVKPVVTIDGQAAVVTLSIPDDHHNSFVQTTLTIYGPALKSLSGNEGQISYEGVKQDDLSVVAAETANVAVSGGFRAVHASGKGSVDFGSSSVESLKVEADHGLAVTAGTVRSLEVTQPEVCPAGTMSSDTSVTVAAVTDGTLKYNGTPRAAATYRTNCATVIVGDEYND